MEILKDIEKNILNINMYSKDIEPTKLNLIKKQIADYYKYKSDESNVITQKIMKYDELYKNPRERNNYEYELFLAKKEELYNIYKETRTLAALYDYLNYKYDTAIIPDIYTYAHINLNEREKIVKDAKAPKAANAKVCPEGKILNPKTNRCVKDPSYKKPKEAKTANAAKEPPKADAKDASASAPAIPAIPAKEPKVCPEGKILNPKTNRCIKDPSYKKPKDAKS
uniref:Uncharacterized protein n=1 Tax=viral metagenome TaxID=1070528 RepID=A0A6C0K5W3_9ZZZZ